MNRPNIPHPWVAVALWMGFILLLIPAGKPFLRLAKLAIGATGVMLVGYAAGALLLVGLLRMLAETLEGLTPTRVVLALACLVVYASQLLLVRYPEELSHPLEYTPLALLLELALPRKLSPWTRALAAMGLAALAAVLDETLQGWMPGRYFDSRDVWLDCVGAALPLLFLRIIDR